MSDSQNPSHESDETAPLLASPAESPPQSAIDKTDHGKGRRRTVTPLPKLQIAILLILQLDEPITSLCIYPFINELLGSLDIVHGDKRKIGYYAGIIESCLFATEAITILQWSRLSDHVGRKPVLLIGTFGLCISMLSFGLSRTFWSLVISRCLAGILNGNSGVMKSMMGDLTDPTNVAKAFAWMPVVSSLGATLGPFLGGSLSRPHDRFPKVFKNDFWVQYPYFLPCFAAACFSTFCFLSALFFLKETVPVRRKARNDVSMPEEGNVYSSEHSEADEEPVTMRGLLTRPVLISVSNYCTLSFLETAFWALLPLFYATPIELGGLNFDPATIGICMSVFGLGNAIVQVLYFPKLVDRFGPKRIFWNGIASFIPIFAMFPIINYLARQSGVTPFIWVLMVTQLSTCILMDMCFGCIFIYINSSAPNRRSLGATNGLSQTTVSIIRTVAPALATSLFAVSVERNLLGGHLIYVVFVVLTCLCLLVAGRLPPDAWDKEKEYQGDQDRGPEDRSVT